MKRNCESTQSLIEKFFNGIDANEVSDTLAVILDSYLHHSPDDRLQLANAANLVRRISAFAFNLERLHKEKSDMLSSLSSETKKSCSHN